MYTFALWPCPPNTNNCINPFFHMPPNFSRVFHGHLPPLLKDHRPFSASSSRRFTKRGCRDPRFSGNWDRSLLTLGSSSSLVGGWTNPAEKMLVKLDHLPRDRGENKKYLSCHHPAQYEENVYPHLSVSYMGATPKMVGFPNKPMGFSYKKWWALGVWNGGTTI